MTDIFISYKREEQSEARRLVDALQRKGWSVWWDPKLRAGERFDDAIERVLNDAKCVIVMWSKLSVNSRYVKDEATYALNREKLVPIAIEEVVLPFRFEGIHTEHLFDWDGSDNHPGYQKLVAEILPMFSAPPVEFENREQNEAAKPEAQKKLKGKEAENQGNRKGELNHGAVGQRAIENTSAQLVKEKPPVTSSKVRFQKRLAIGIAVIAVMIIISLIGWLFFIKPKYAKTFKNSVGMKFELISAGSFTMGSDPAIGERYELPPHTVNISRPFFLQKTEVTQGQWKVVMGYNPSYFKECGDFCPVENVSWEDAHRFINKLNQMEDTDKYRLPTEAEWEYAVRARTTTAFSFGDEEDKLAEYAWYSSNADGQTHPVGTKKPNAWGLYDMHGNVWEMVEDDWNNDYNGAPDDGSARIRKPTRNLYYVARGGGWFNLAKYCRSAIRTDWYFKNSVNWAGFRLARSVALAR